MRTMRSLSFSRLSNPKAHSDEADMMDPPNQFAPGHSRESSGTSSASSPVPSTFSSTGHHRVPGSTSSLETAPESPANVAKSLLHDLVEDPEEGELSSIEYCICDAPQCEHRKTITPSTAQHSPITPEWIYGDDQFSFSGFTDGRSFKRRKSGDAAASNSVRHSRRWPSITKRWIDRKATTSLSNPTVRSAPPSRSSSFQTPSVHRSLASHLYQADPFTPPATPARSRNTSLSRSKGPPEPIDIKAAERPEDPVDRENQSTTPLLPPVMTSLRRRHEEGEVRSPLQSPSVAPASTCNTPISSPASPGMTTPNLSAKPSIASITIGHNRYQPSLDIPTMTISDEFDPWAAKLGHANFTVYPEPYVPEIADNRTCNALLEDWELARSRYMRHAARITENYGPTSQTYRYTEQKWAEIDAVWRQNLEDVNAQAEANGESPAFQSLAETQPVSRIPTLNDPDQPNKFPEIGDDEIVGPMVTYARAATEKPPAKKNMFLKLLTSPAALLGRRRPSA